MSTLWTPTNTRAGLRFQHDQAATLNRYANQFETDGHHEHVTLFRQAARAAERREPLIIEGSNPSEIKRMAEGFALYPGVAEPTIDQLQ